ncbi:MAG: hypothetical protein AAF074_02825 [Pseudomonadota bacterium]
MILIDKLKNATVSNGMLRLSCIAIAADGSEQPSGEILIPVNRIAPVMGELNTVVKQLREKAQAHIDAQKEAEAAGAPMDSQPN